MPRLRERREFRRVRTPDDPRPGFRVVCGDPGCQRSAIMHSNKWLKIPNEQIEKFFEEQNWYIGRAADQDRCPEHSYRYRHERAHTAKERATIEAKQLFAHEQEQKDQRLEAAITAYAKLTEEEAHQFCTRLGLITPAAAQDAFEKSPEPLAEPAGIPFMITNAMKDRLRALGCTDEVISNLRPVEAHRIIRAGEPAPKPNGKPIAAKVEPPVSVPPPPADEDLADDDLLQASDIEDTANIIFGRR